MLYWKLRKGFVFLLQYGGAPVILADFGGFPREDLRQFWVIVGTIM